MWPGCLQQAGHLLDEGLPAGWLRFCQASSTAWPTWPSNHIVTIPAARLLAKMPMSTYAATLRDNSSKRGWGSSLSRHLHPASR